MERVARHDFRDLAPSDDAWYQTPLGVFAHAMERDAVLALADAKPVERAFGVEGSWRACSNATGWRRAPCASCSIFRWTGAFIAVLAWRQTDDA